MTVLARQSDEMIQAHIDYNKNNGEELVPRYMLVTALMEILQLRRDRRPGDGRHPHANWDGE